MDDQESSLPVGLIIGLVVGAVLILLLGALGFLMFRVVAEVAPGGAPAVVAVAAEPVDFDPGPPLVEPVGPKVGTAHEKLLGTWEVKTLDDGRATLQFAADGTMQTALARPGKDKETRFAIRWEVLAEDGNRVTVRRSPPDGAAQVQVFLFENADRFTVQGEGGGAVYERNR